MNPERYKPDEAQEEAHFVSNMAHDVADSVGDERLNTEHYNLANITIEQMYKDIGRKTTIPLFHSIEAAGEDKELKDESQKALGSCFAILKRQYPEAPGTFKANMITDPIRAVQQLNAVCANFAGRLTQMIVDKFGARASDEFKAAFSQTVYQLSKSCLTDQNYEFEIKKPEYDFNLLQQSMGKRIDDFSFQDGASFEFAEGQEPSPDKPLYQGTLKIRSSDGTPQVIDLSSYLQDEGKHIYFSGLSGGTNFDAAARPIDQNNYEVSLDPERLQESELRAVFTTFHEIGHIKTFGKGDVAILDRAVSVAMDLPNFDYLNIAGQDNAYMAKIQRFVDELTRALLDEGHDLEMPGDELAREKTDKHVLMARNIIATLPGLIDVLKNPDHIPPEPILQLVSHLPFLESYFALEHEEAANRYAIEQLEKSMPDIYDFQNRAATLTKIAQTMDRKVYGGEVVAHAE